MNCNNLLWLIVNGLLFWKGDEDVEERREADMGGGVLGYLREGGRELVTRSAGW